MPTDLYNYRNEILTLGKKRDSDGVRPVVRSGWYSVNINGFGDTREPEDTVTEKFFSTDKPVTGFVRVEPEALGAANSPVGGNVTLPTS